MASMHRGQLIVLLAIVCAIQLCSAHANHVHNHHNSHGAQHSTNWLRTEVLDGNGLFVLDWRKSGKDIVFRATVNTRGYIGLGFSYKSEKIGDADIMLAWVDDQTGEPNVLVSACKLLHSMWLGELRGRTLVHNSNGKPVALDCMRKHFMLA